MNRTMRRLVEMCFAAVVLCASVKAGGDPEQPREGPRQPEVPVLKVEEYTLPNGLKVILHEDHKTPVVSVNVWYKVGSKDENRGRTGFAHLFEHLMFQGSRHYDQDYFLPLEKIGADLNGQTSEDETMYYETVPSNALELALWLESDRMGFLLQAMTQEKLDNQRDVVKNERRQTVDNVPYGQAEETLLQALYPPDHPYHHSVIGSMADLSAARLDDVAAFFRHYYVPNNALLCVAGDFQPEAARRWIEKYFGPLPRGGEISPPKPNVPALSAARHITMTDAVSLPRAQLIWPTVPLNHPDEAALDVLAAILAAFPRKTACSARSCTTGSLRPRSMPHTPLTCSRGRSRSIFMPRPAGMASGSVSLASRTAISSPRPSSCPTAIGSPSLSGWPTPRSIASNRTDRATWRSRSLKARGRAS